MATPFRMKRLVEFGDTDMAGIVHFAKFFHYMEAAEHALLRSLGFSVSMEWEGTPIGLPRVAASCDYIKPARFEDELEVCVLVRRLGRSSITYGFDVLRGAETIAHGQITVVCCVTAPGRKMEAIDIPAPLRAKLEPFIQSPVQ
jgi:acyl-CoA thioester hydrolase